MENSLAAFSDHLAGLVERSGTGIVTVNPGRRRTASGVVWRPGLVVTSHHAVRDGDNTVVLAEGTEVKAEVAGRDPATGLAFLRAEAGPGPARFDAAGVRPGALVLALGLRPETGITASVGIVSSVRHVIALDFSLYPGCSGGAAFNMEGAVIGIATMALTQAGGAAVPNSTVDRVLDAVLRRGYVAKAYLGIGTIPVSLRHECGGGLMLVNVEPGSPADQAGLLLGDILVAIGGKPVRQLSHLQAVLSPESIGSPLGVSLIRAGSAQEVTVTPGERPATEEN